MMIKLAFLLFAVSVSSSPAGYGNKTSDRILGGNFAQEGQFKHQVSMKRDGFHQCGGSILDRTTILTAAHCFYGISGHFTIEVGTNSLMGGGTVHQISAIRNHEFFNPVLLNFDIAIAKLNTNIVFGPKVNVIAIQNVEVYENVWCEASGWGATNSGPSSERLMYVQLLSITNEKCKEMQQTYEQPKIYDHQLCAFNGIGQGVCHGDSGGPLTVNGGLAGIVSWGRPCAVGFPDVFTRVTSFMDWIQLNRV